MYWLLFCFAACDATATAAPPASVEVGVAATGPIRAAYEALRATCASGELPVWTPMEARILRNTPYAIAGLRFTDPGLVAVFSADGGWYRPTVDAPQPLAPVDAACVAALAAREQALRGAWALPAEVEARMIRDHALFQVFRLWGNTAVTPYGKPSVQPGPDGALRVWLPAADCLPAPGEDCSGFGIECPPDGPCHSVAAG